MYLPKACPSPKSSLLPPSEGCELHSVTFLQGSVSPTPVGRAIVMEGPDRLGCKGLKLVKEATLLPSWNCTISTHAGIFFQSFLLW